MTLPPLLKSPLAAALAPGAAISAAPHRDPARAAVVRRAKLWELGEKHLCPVIGTCLPIGELAKLARRHFSLIDPRNEFAMHVEAVNRASRRNAVSEAIQNYLERTYRTQILRFESAKGDAEVLTAWREHYACGEVAGALWAAATHRAASADTKLRIYADVHMLSHQIGAGQAADVRRLAQMERECAAAKAALERQKESQVASQAKLGLKLQKALAERDRLRADRDELVRRQVRLSVFESGSAMTEMGRQLISLQAANEELMGAAQRGWALEKTLQAAHREALVLAGERDQLSAERDALERLLLAGAAEPGVPDRCAGDCAECEPVLLGQCVLYVGGRSSLLAHYRALAGRLGVRLIHHDGGLEESLSRLPEMINGADAVICPTDCVSHSAYYQLKRQCKRSGKPCLLFKGAGISGFAVALARLSAGQQSLLAAPVVFS